MSQEWYLMNSLPVFNSGFEQEEFDDYAMSGFSELLNSPINNTIQIYNNSLKIWSDVKVIVQNNTADSEQQSEFRQILSVIGTLKRGMYIKYRNDIWLVISHPDNNKIYDKAIIQKCNYTLPFQTNSSTIIQEPCIVIDTTKASGTGEDEGKIITLSDTQRAILIQYNENTKYLIEGKRIFIDQLTDKPKVYKITKVDRITHMNGEHGLLQLTCDECEVILNKDKPELKIADYISTEPSPTPTPSSSGTSYITDTKGNIYTTIKQIKVGGLAVPFDCVFKDTSGNVVQNISPKWALIVSDDLKDKVMLTYSNSYPNRVYIQVLEGNENIGKQFNLTLEDANSLFGKCTLTIQVVS